MMKTTTSVAASGHAVSRFAEVVFVRSEPVRRHAPPRCGAAPAPASRPVRAVIASSPITTGRD